MASIRKVRIDSDDYVGMIAYPSESTLRFEITEINPMQAAGLAHYLRNCAQHWIDTNGKPRQRFIGPKGDPTGPG